MQIAFHCIRLLAEPVFATRAVEWEWLDDDIGIETIKDRQDA
jgi:hypothetical protein